jgi:hypothetical protein
MAQRFSNAARALLAATINDTDTAFSIEADGSLFPVANTGSSAIGPSADWFKLVLQDTTGYEIVYVRTHVSGSLDFSNVLRGQEGTTARSFLSGSTVGLRPTAADAEHVNDTANPHGVTKSQVGLGNVDNTADATKNVLSASKWTTARTITLGGDLSGSVSIDGTDNVTLTAMVSDNSHAHVIGNVDGLQSALDSKAASSHSHGISDVTGLQSALDGKASSSHSHAISDVTGLQTALDAKAPAASPTLTGNVEVAGSYRSNVTAMAALSVDCSAGNYFTKTIAANSTFTFDSVPSGAYSFTLELTHTSGTITWPAAVKWPGDTAPTLTTGKTHLFMFVTDDGGTRWRGAALAGYVS